MKRILYLLCLVLFCATAVPAQTNKKIKNLQSQRTELKKRLNESQQLLRSTNKSVKSQLANLNVLSGQIEQQQKYIVGIEGEVNVLNGNIGQLTRELHKLQQELADCKLKYSRSVMYMYRNRSTQNKLMFLFSSKNFSQMFRRLRYVMDYAKYQRAQGEVIKIKEKAVHDKRNQLLGVQAQKNALLAEGRKENERLEQQHREHQQIVGELQKKQKQLRSTISQTQRRYASLNKQIDRLIQQEIAAAERRRKAEEARREAARRKAEAARKAEEARREAAAKKNRSASSKSKSSKSKSSSSSSRSKSSTSTPRFQEQSSEDRRLSNNFAANKGRLPMPITGSYVISSHYGQYKVAGLSGVSLDNKGINITGRSGAQARAVFNGEVSAVFSFGGMINILVRHGSYISVYCNLSSASVHKGQQVSTRQVLGSVAPDASGNCTLHFQLRRETTKLNPESWLGR